MSGYLDFKRTGNLEVDAILSMIEEAGNSYHNTSQWADGDDGDISYIEKINDLIDDAAIKLNKQPNVKLTGSPASGESV